MNGTDRPASARVSPTTFDPGAILALVEHDWSLLTDLVEVFRHETPPLVEEISRHLRLGSAERLAGAAHRLRGNLSAFGLGAAWKSAGALESAARAAALVLAETELAVLLEELRRLDHELVAFVSRAAVA